MPNDNGYLVPEDLPDHVENLWVVPVEIFATAPTRQDAINLAGDILDFTYAEADGLLGFAITSAIPLDKERLDQYLATMQEVQAAMAEHVPHGATP